MHHKLKIEKQMTKQTENIPQGTANIADDRVLATSLCFTGYLDDNQKSNNSAAMFHVGQVEVLLMPLMNHDEDQVAVNIA